MRCVWTCSQVWKVCALANSPVQATLCQEAVSAEWDQGWLLLSRSSLCCSAGAPEKEKLPAREPVTGVRGSGAAAVSEVGEHEACCRSEQTADARGKVERASRWLRPGCPQRRGHLRDKELTEVVTSKWSKISFQSPAHHLTLFSTSSSLRCDLASKSDTRIGSSASTSQPLTVSLCAVTSFDTSVG